MKKTKKQKTGGQINHISTCPTFPTVSIKQANTQYNILSVFPNPFTNEINLNFEGARNVKGIITMTDIDGNLVYKDDSYIPALSSKLEFGYLPVGIYILKYNTQDNSYTIKINKQ